MSAKAPDQSTRNAKLYKQLKSYFQSEELLMKVSRPLQAQIQHTDPNPISRIH